MKTAFANSKYTLNDMAMTAGFKYPYINSIALGPIRGISAPVPKAMPLPHKKTTNASKRPLGFRPAVRKWWPAKK